MVIQKKTPNLLALLESHVGGVALEVSVDSRPPTPSYVGPLLMSVEKRKGRGTRGPKNISPRKVRSSLMWIKSPLRDIRSLGVGVIGVRLGLVDWDREKWSCHLVLWSRCHVYSALLWKD